MSKDSDPISASFVIRASSFLRHSSFVIRHFNHGPDRSKTESELARAIVFAGDRGRTGHHHQAFQEHALWTDQGHHAISRAKVGFESARTLPRRTRAGEGCRGPGPLRCLSAL